MALDPRLILGGTQINPQGAAQSALLGAQQLQQLQQQQAIAPLQQQAAEIENERRLQQLQAGRQAQQAQDINLQQQFDINEVRSMAFGALPIKQLLDQGNVQGALENAKARAEKLQELGRSDAETQELVGALEAGNIEEAQQMVGNAIELGRLTGAVGSGDTNQELTRAFAPVTVFNPETGQNEIVVPTLREGELEKLPIGQSAKLTLEQQLEKRQREADIAVGKKRGEKRVESQEGRNTKVINDGIRAASELPELRRMLDLVNQIDTGGFQSAVTGATNFFGKTPANVGEFNSLAGQRVLAGLDAFSGAISEGERKFVERISPGLRQGKEVNKRVLERLASIAENAVERARKRAADTGDEFALEDLQIPEIGQPAQAQGGQTITLPNGVVVKRIQ